MARMRRPTPALSCFFRVNLAAMGVLYEIGVGALAVHNDIILSSQAAFGGKRKG